MQEQQQQQKQQQQQQQIPFGDDKQERQLQLRLQLWTAGCSLVVGGGFAGYFEGADEEEDGDGEEGDPADEAEAVHKG